MKFYLPTLKHLVIQLAKLQIYTLSLTTTFWHCKKKSHYFWTGVYIPPAIHMYPKNYENKYTTMQCTKLYCPRFGLSTFCMSTFLVGRCFDMSTFWLGLVCRRFGLSTFWSVDVSVCRRFGLLMFWYVDVLVCRRFSLSTFWSVDISVSQCFGLSTFWLSTFRFLDVLTSYLQKGPLWHTKSFL